MKITWTSRTAVLVCSLALITAAAPVTTTKLVVSHYDSVSYLLGLGWEHSINIVKDSLKPALIFRGFKDNLSSKPPLVDPADDGNIMSGFMKQVSGLNQKWGKEEGAKNAAEGAKFLAENKKKPGVITTASGLQYVVLKEGAGPKPVTTDSVTLKYRGTLLNGKEFTSTDRKGPVSVPLDRVNKGCQEALLLMGVGSKYRLFLPPTIGYGQMMFENKTEPNSTTIFDLELVGIKK